MKTIKSVAQLSIVLLLLAVLGCKKDPAQPEALWRPLNADPDLAGFGKITFYSEQVGWVSGGAHQTQPYTAVLLRTTDGGASWSKVELRPYQIGQFVT